MQILSQSYPVLIGSKALLEYGFDILPNDIDLIVDETCARDIHYTCSEKKDKMCFFNFEGINHKVDLMLCDKSPVNKIIWEYCNTNPTKYITLFGTIKVIVCPLEILYVIKKSHLHRILPISGSKSYDIEIWYKHVNMYELMRQKLGYEKMDLILYGKDKYGKPIDLNSNLISNLEDMCRLVFKMNFDETINRVGDTLISMEKSNDDFFTDNVERFIEHDDLHKEIALMCRGVDTVLYDDFKEDSNSASLSKNLFIGAESNKRNQCLYEEVMVLLLERKYIPQMIKCHVEPKIPIDKCNKDEMLVNLKEIVAHFATNLCGQGHSWLRQYVIDHIHLLVNSNAYDLDALYKLCATITKADEIESNIKQHNLTDMLNKIQTHKLDKDLLPDIGIYDTYKSYSIGDGYSIFNLEGVRIKNIKKNMNITFTSHLDYKPYNVYIDMLISGNGKIIFDDPFSDEVWFYNVDKNFGLIIRENNPHVNMTIFYCKISMDGKYTVKINGEYYKLDSLKNPSTFNQSYTKKYKMYYYYSSSCTEFHERNYDGTSNYLSSYGSSPASLDILFEKIARYNLNLKHDTENNSHYDSYEEGTGSG